MRRYPFNLQPAVIPIVIAWAAGSVCTILGLWCQDHMHSTATPQRIDVVSLAAAVVFISTLVGVVVFPSCLAAAMLALRLLSRGSLLWHPLAAAFVGLLVGPLVMELWASGYVQHLVIPSSDDSSVWLFGGVAAIVGGTFACLFARRMARLASDLPPLPGAGSP